MEHIFKEIEQERARQDANWGVQNHHPLVWCAVLGEEVGEVNKAALGKDWLDNYRKELIQVAAVSVAMIQSLDRDMKAVKCSNQLEIEFPEN